MDLDYVQSLLGKRYDGCLEAAGAKILDSQAFGSYQGDSIYKIEKDGQILWIIYGYGSCGGCDQFEGEISDNFSDVHWNDSEASEDRVNACYEAMQELGKQMIESGVNLEDAIKIAGRNHDWDEDSETMVQWIKNHS